MGTLCKSKSKLVCKVFHTAVRHYFFPPRASIKENDLEWCWKSRLRYCKLCLNRLFRHSDVYSILCAHVDTYFSTVLHLRSIESCIEDLIKVGVTSVYMHAY